MQNILILFAHPRTDRSEVNVVLADAARGVDGVTLVDLYAEYPNFDIDVDREQDRLLAHDVLVFQHPVYWYSCPAILKEWQDLVLEYGFAYGSEGRALEGKTFFSAVSCGARREAYSRDGAYQFELRELFQPFEQTMRLCRVRYLPPFVVYAAGHAVEEGRLESHVGEYVELLAAVAEGRLDYERAALSNTLSDNLAGLVRSSGEVH